MNYESGFKLLLAFNMVCLLSVGFFILPKYHTTEINRVKYLIDNYGSYCYEGYCVNKNMTFNDAIAVYDNHRLYGDIFINIAVDYVCEDDDTIFRYLE